MWSTDCFYFLCHKPTALSNFFSQKVDISKLNVTAAIHQSENLQHFKKMFSW